MKVNRQRFHLQLSNHAKWFEEKKSNKTKLVHYSLPLLEQHRS